MNKSDREIKDEVLKRAAALDRKAKRRKQTIPAVVIGAIVFLSPFSVSLLPASAPDSNEYNTEYYTEPSTVFYTVNESDKTFIYHAPVKKPITEITVRGVSYHVNNDIAVTDENMGEFIENVNIDSVTCAVYAYKNNSNTVILSTGAEQIAFTCREGS